MPHRISRLAPAMLLALAACDGGPSVLDTGALTITVSASGIDLDERFTLTIDGGDKRPYTGASLTAEGLAAGVHTVDLSGVSPNCTVQGSTQLRVTVAAGETSAAAFTMTCVARFIVFSQALTGTADLYRISRTGENLVRLTHTGDNRWPAASPDGGKVAFASARDGNYEIYVMNADGSSATRLTHRPAMDMDPAWSPDGTRIVFTSFEWQQGRTLWTMNADGSGLARIPVVGTPYQPRWSPDGSRIVVSMSDSTAPSRDLNIYTIAVATGAATRLTSGTTPDLEPSWTPDGRIMYVTNWPMSPALYIMNADGTGQAPLYDHPMHAEMSARMSPDGTMLLYSADALNGTRPPLFVVPVSGGTPQQIAPFSVVVDWMP